MHVFVCGKLEFTCPFVFVDARLNSGLEVWRTPITYIVQVLLQTKLDQMIHLWDSTLHANLGADCDLINMSNRFRLIGTHTFQKITHHLTTTHESRMSCVHLDVEWTQDDTKLTSFRHLVSFG